jgi:hypothetical protein
MSINHLYALGVLEPLEVQDVFVLAAGAFP